jgi:septum site-determining protein MinD
MMSKVISVHSFRGGTGKSVIVANLAALLAAQGKKVAVIDTNLESPSLHVLFNLPEEEFTYSLNDYLWGRCNSIQQTLHDVTSRLQPDLPGQVFLIPGSTHFFEIRRIIQQGYDVGLLNYGCYELTDKLGLDTLIIDTQPGLNAETLASIAIVSSLVIVTRLDNQDYRGTGLLIDLARKFDLPFRRLMIVNEVPLAFDLDDVKTKLQQTFECEVAAVLPYSDEMMSMPGPHIFVFNYPDHPLTLHLKEAMAQLMAS